MTTVTDLLAELFDIDRTRYIFRDGLPMVRHATHVHMCWTPRENRKVK